VLLPDVDAALAIAAGGREKVESIVEKDERFPGAISVDGAGVGRDGGDIAVVEDRLHLCNV